MSKIAANEITDKQGSGRPSFTNGVQTSNINGGQIGGRRNLIINGAMQVAQRGTSATVNNSAAFTVDRHQLEATNTGANLLFTQETDAPDGFKNSIKVEVTSAASPLTNSASIRYIVEGNDISGLGFGTPAAKTITLSFWVKSSVTGLIGGSLANNAFDRTYPFEYTVNSFNTWEKKIITIEGDTSGTWVTDNGIGLRLNFSLGADSSRQASPGSWANSVARQPTGGIAFVENAGATWYLTGVQLEVGDTATEFEHRSYGEELALCQRYFYQFSPSANFPAFQYQGNFRAVPIQFPVTMRSAPSFTPDGFFNMTSFDGSAISKTSLYAWINISSTDTTSRGIVGAKLDAEL